MNAASQTLDILQQGVILTVTIEDFHFKAYVVISDADINRVADFVPRDQFEQEGDLHVTAVGHADEAREQVQDLTFNMNPGDAAVFLCVDTSTYEAVLAELGQAPTAPLN